MKNPSPSRCYVAICDRTNFEGYYCKLFILPTTEENSIDNASWYFLNRLDYTACLHLMMTVEDYKNLTGGE